MNVKDLTLAHVKSHLQVREVDKEEAPLPFSATKKVTIALLGLGFCFGCRQSGGFQTIKH